MNRYHATRHVTISRFADVTVGLLKSIHFHSCSELRTEL